MTDNAPAGWYPDPTDRRVLRWWDGRSWTSHVWPGAGTGAVGRLEDEESPGRWARVALLVEIAAQLVGFVTMRATFRSFLDDVTSSIDAGADYTPYLWGRWPAILTQLTGAVWVATGVLFLVWFARSAANARALGLPARRSPAAGVAGFMIPIINLWWPYQSTRDLLPEGHPRRPLVLQWFLLWVVGGFVGGAVTFGSIFVESWLGWVLLAIPAVLVTLAALAAREVVAVVVETHASLARFNPPG